MKRYLNIGDRVELEMGASEVCLHMGVTGQRMIVEVREHGAQLYTLDGKRFSSPITWGEAGIYTDYNHGGRPWTSETRYTSRGKLYEPREFLVHTPGGPHYGRDADLEGCINAAKLLGKGAKVEGLDDMLCQTGDIIFEVQ